MNLKIKCDARVRNFKLTLPKGLNIKGIYGREMYETWYKMDQLLKSGLDISKLLTHELPSDEYEKAFEIMESGQCGKIILEW